MEAIVKEDFSTSSWCASYQASTEAQKWVKHQTPNLPTSIRGLELCETYDRGREDGRQNDYRPGTISSKSRFAYNAGWDFGRQEVEQA